MSILSSATFNRQKWQAIVIFTLAFWLGSSLLLDGVIMPGLYAAGMITDAAFATAGYSIFWMFNRLEVLSAALVLTGMLVLYFTRSSMAPVKTGAIALSLLLFAIPLIYTYGLTPQMGALGMQLNLFSGTTEVPEAMSQMHQGYWVLELLKLLASGALLSLCYQSLQLNAPHRLTNQG